MPSVRVDRLPRRVRIATAQAGADLGRVAGKVLADDIQAESAQDRQRARDNLFTTLD
jgi:hypothetical protein